MRFGKNLLINDDHINRPQVIIDCRKDEGIRLSNERFSQAFRCREYIPAHILVSTYQVLWYNKHILYYIIYLLLYYNVGADLVGIVTTSFFVRLPVTICYIIMLCHDNRLFSLTVPIFDPQASIVVPHALNCVPLCTRILIYWRGTLLKFDIHHSDFFFVVQRHCRSFRYAARLQLLLSMSRGNDVDRCARVRLLVSSTHGENGENEKFALFQNLSDLYNI